MPGAGRASDRRLMSWVGCRWDTASCGSSRRWLVTFRALNPPPTPPPGSHTNTRTHEPLPAVIVANAVTPPQPPPAAARTEQVCLRTCRRLAGAAATHRRPPSPARCKETRGLPAPPATEHPSAGWACCGGCSGCGPPLWARRRPAPRRGSGRPPGQQTAWRRHSAARCRQTRRAASARPCRRPQPCHGEQRRRRTAAVARAVTGATEPAMRCGRCAPTGCRTESRLERPSPACLAGPTGVSGCVVGMGRRTGGRRWTARVAAPAPQSESCRCCCSSRQTVAPSL